jgi:hypothetical protein
MDEEPSRPRILSAYNNKIFGGKGFLWQLAVVI